MAASATSGVFLTNPSSLCFRKTDSSKRSSFRTRAVSELGFVTSQLSGIKISCNHWDVIGALSAPLTPPLQPIIARNKKNLSFFVFMFLAYNYLCWNVGRNNIYLLWVRLKGRISPVFVSSWYELIVYGLIVKKGKCVSLRVLC
jgi:hypothetical protein